MYDVVQGDDVGVLELLEQRRLADGRERRALFLLQADLLQGNHLVRKAGKGIKREREKKKSRAMFVSMKDVTTTGIEEGSVRPGTLMLLVGDEG